MNQDITLGTGPRPNRVLKNPDFAKNDQSFRYEDGPDFRLLDLFSAACYGPITANFSQRMVRVGKTPVHLTPTELRILVMLMREPGRVFTRGQIIDRVFDDDFEGFDRTADAHVSSLRRKLEALEKSRYIHTIYGVGYRFGDG